MQWTASHHVPLKKVLHATSIFSANHSNAEVPVERTENICLVTVFEYAAGKPANSSPKALRANEILNGYSKPKKKKKKYSTCNTANIVILQEVKSESKKKGLHINFISYSFKLYHVTCCCT